MKIKQIKVKYSQDHVIVSASCAIRHFGRDEIYFKFDRKYEDYLFPDASPFAACLLVASMKKGEDLIIEGAISEQLYKGMHEIMKVMLSWNIGLQPIRIIPQNLVRDTQNPKFVASFFSGGVDAF